MPRFFLYHKKDPAKVIKIRPEPMKIEAILMLDGEFLLTVAGDGELAGDWKLDAAEAL